MAAYLLTSGEVAGSTNVTPSGGIRRTGADQYRLDQAFARQTRRGFEHARIGAFGKRDRLFQFAGPLDEPGHEQSCRFRNGSHWRRNLSLAGGQRLQNVFDLVGKRSGHVAELFIESVVEPA